MSAHPPAGAQSSSDLQAVAEAERSGRPFLLFRDRDGRQRLFFFEPGTASVSVGRRSSADLAIDWDEQVSRLHARFEPAGDAWAVVDDGFSSNGTFVNEERLSGTRQLSDGDRLRFGATTITFRAPAPEPAPAHAPERRPAAAPASPPAPSPARERPAVALSSTQRRVLAALCRPYRGRGAFATPATDDDMAEELFLSAGEVRAHLRVLSAKLGVAELPEAEARVRLVERAFSTGLIAERDL